MKDLQNKVVIITGAANGLGKALSHEFFIQGCHLALIDINLTGLEMLKNSFGHTSQKITIHCTDISQEQEVIAAKTNIIKQHQQADILINNAGISNSQLFPQVETREFERLFKVNFWGTVFCTKHFLTHLQEQPESHIVNIISGFALMGFPGKTTYASSKSAIMGFTNSLKTELADTSVSVCLVIPPPLNTNLVINGPHISTGKKENEIAFIKKHSMPVEKAAKQIVSKVNAGKYRIIIGTTTYWIDLFSRFFPTTLHNLVAKNKKHIPFV